MLRSFGLVNSCCCVAKVISLRSVDIAIRAKWPLASSRRCWQTEDLNCNLTQGPRRTNSFPPNHWCYLLSRLPHKVLAPEWTLCSVVSKICQDVRFRHVMVTRCHLADILTGINNSVFRQISSSETRIKQIGSKVYSLQAEVFAVLQSS